MLVKEFNLQRRTRARLVQRADHDVACRAVRAMHMTAAGLPESCVVA